MVAFHILGPVRLHVHGRVADLGPTKIRGLLGILLLSADTPVAADTIVDRLWDKVSGYGSTAGTKGREPPPRPHKTLQTYVSKLRASLEKAQAPARLLTEHGHYRLRVDKSNIDYYRFRELADEGQRATRRSDHARAAASLGSAVELWQGHPLADVHSSWAQRYGETLVAQELMPVYYGLFKAHLALGHAEHVLAQLRPLLVVHETDETLIELQMRALADVNEPGSIANCFRDFTQKLKELAHTKPTERLTQVYRRLIDQSPMTGLSETPGPVYLARQLTSLQLPRDIPYFIGRAGIIRQLDALLAAPDSPSAIVCLHGGPGVGKTALATHWAHHRRGHFTDGTLYADLNGYGPGLPAKPATVLATFLEALGIPLEHVPDSIPGRAALLQHELAGRRLLVVLDNARDSAQVRPLLTATSPCPVLVTSRQKLSAVAYHHGAHSITIPTLLIDEAMALLQRRIGEHRANHDLSAIHELAALCDGLPLGLRIVSEHIAARPDAPLGELVEHLRDHRRLLDAGSHGDSDPKTLRAVFDWSCNALPPEPDRLFRLLGLHPSTRISTPAAAAIANLSAGDTERIFDVLVGAHLVHQQSVDSYALHDLVHLYASDRAQREEPREARRDAVHRMADWYLHTAVNAIQQISPQRPLVPALSRATNVVPHIFQNEDDAMRWCLRERAQILAITRLAADYEFYDHVWRLVGTFNDMLNRYGDPHESISVHLVALKATRICGARDGEAGTLNNIGIINFNLGEHERASRYFTQALAIFREIDDERNEAMCLYNLGIIHIERGAFRKAIELHERSLAISQRMGDKAGQARVYHRIGEAYQRQDRTDLAASYYYRSLGLRAQTTDRRGQAETLAKLGELYLEAGNPSRAIEYCEQALTIDRRTFDQRKAAAALRTRAVALYQLGNHADAIASGQEAVDICHAMSDLRGEARSLDILGYAQNAIGEYAAAQRNWSVAFDLFSRLEDPQAATIRYHLNAAMESTGSLPEPRTTPLTGENGELLVPPAGNQQLTTEIREK